MNRLIRYPAYYDVYMTKMVKHYDRFRTDLFTADKNVIETSKHIDKTERNL